MNKCWVYTSEEVFFKVYSPFAQVIQAGLSMVMKAVKECLSQSGGQGTLIPHVDTDSM